MEKRGTFIAFVGMTGVDKDVQSLLLQDELKKQGDLPEVKKVPILFFHFYKKEIEELLIGGYTVVAYFEADIQIEKKAIGDEKTRKLLTEEYSNLKEEGLIILLDATSESNSFSKEESEKIRQIYYDMALNFGWQIAEGDQSLDKVHNNIWTKVFLEITQVHTG